MSLKAGGTESCWANPDEDGQLDRSLWRCVQCPLQETCKKSRHSFKNACLFSYESEERVREYIKRHVMLAGVHREDQLSEDVAEDWANTADVEWEIETFQDRVAYRTQLDEMHERPKAEKRSWEASGWDEADHRKAKAKGGVKGKGKVSSNDVRVRELQTAVKQLTEVVTSAAASSIAGGSGGSPLAASNVLALSSRAPSQQGIEMVTDSVNRILESIGQATSQCITTARTLNEEGTRLRSAAMCIERAFASKQ